MVSVKGVSPSAVEVTFEPAAGEHEVKSYEATLAPGASPSWCSADVNGQPPKCEIGSLRPGREYDVYARVCYKIDSPGACSGYVKMTAHTQPPGKVMHTT